MNAILEAYLIALFVFIHFSLLICEKPTCFFDSKNAIALPNQLQKFVVNVFKLIPIQLEFIQIVAQFCLFGDLILIIMMVMKILGNIIKNLLIIIGIACVIMLVMYGISNYDSSMIGKIVTESKGFFSNLFKQTPKIKGY